MKMIKTMIYLVLALILLFSPAIAIVEHIKQETVERMKNSTSILNMQSGIGNQEIQDDQFGQTQSTGEQYVSDQMTMIRSNGQEQIGGDYQSGYQAGYANGWWDGVQATVQLLLKYITSLQDTSTALSEFDRYGIGRPGGQAIMEGPKIKQALDAATLQVGEL